MGSASGLEARVALDLTGSLALQGRDAAAGLRLWAEGAGVALGVVDLAGVVGGPEQLYATWSRSDADVVLLPYGSGRVRAALRGASGRRLVWNHGGTDDELARPWAPMVPAPASTYFAPLVDLAAARDCRSVTILCGSGGFATRVGRGAADRAGQLGLPVRSLALSDGLPGRSGPAEAVLVVGRFEDDVEVVSALRGRCRFVGCVAAGIPAFGEALGDRADGVWGPAQWWPDAAEPDLGPSGRDFVRRFRDLTGRVPSYVAAQAFAAGHLSLAALEQPPAAGEIGGWSTSTLLGEFEVDMDGRQVGHRVTVVRWRGGRMVPVR